MPTTAICSSSAGHPAGAALYPTGRFSGGTNYIDTLGTLLGRADRQFRDRRRAHRQHQHQRSAGCPASSPNGIAIPWPAAVGAFPTVSGTFDENDLLAVSIGGNDARFYQQNGGTVAGAPAAATASAAFATAGLNALVGAGAQNISFLAGNTALLAGNRRATRPPQAIRTAYSTTFNTGMQSTLAGYAADGVIVHYLDLTLCWTRSPPIRPPMA